MDGPSPPPPTPRDPSLLFYQRNSVRRGILWSYWLVVFAALPAWWYATSIERLSLPLSRVHAQALRRLRLPIHICLASQDIIFAHRLENVLSGKFSSTPPQLGVELEIYVLHENSCRDKVGAYYVLGTSQDPFVHGRQLHVPPLSDASLSTVSDLLIALLAPYSGPHVQEHRVVQYSPRYRLSFSLLNEDSSAGGSVMAWDIERALSRHIQPINDQLWTLHNFTIESQVQYHAPLAFKPRSLPDGQHGLTTGDLTVFVNSAEWTLSSSVSNDPVLHFILFIPSADRRPLRLLDRNGRVSQSTSFLLPQWGGIVIHNPTSSSPELPIDIMDEVFALFAYHLRALIGTPQLPPGITRSPLDNESVLNDWQMDALLRRRAFENVQGAQDTLRSIVTLVDKIEGMPVGEDTRGDIVDALDALANMYRSSNASLSRTVTYSSEAFKLATRAFFNPNMLALLYFPADHKYAVYIPLFASAITPLFVAALREIRAYRKERKEVKAAIERKDL